MKLPVTIKDLGDPITIKRGDAQGHLGYMDPRNGDIVLSEGMEPLGEVTILIHEMLHVAEAGMHTYGTLAEDVYIDHEFIHGAAFAVGIALARAGVLKGIGEAEIKEYLAAAAAELEEEDAQ